MRSAVAGLLPGDPALRRIALSTPVASDAPAWLLLGGILFTAAVLHVPWWQGRSGPWVRRAEQEGRRPVVR